MLEYLDRASLDLLRPRFSDTPRAGAALLFEQIVDSDGVLDEWEARLNASGAVVERSWFAASDADRERFRAFRHALPEAVNDVVRRNGFMKVGSDYSVPIERNREMLAFYREHLDRDFAARAVVFGHIGDGHVHVNVLPASQEDFAKAGEMMLHFARQAVAFGGSVAAEHGLGKRKAHLLEIQYPAAAIEAMKQVKRRLDPEWRLGRGTLFADEP
jgi:FAD/FMN-containing dehydrogenase